MHAGTAQYLLAPERVFSEVRISAQIASGAPVRPRQYKGLAMQTETPDCIMRVNAVLDRTGLSRSTMYRKMQNGTFPRNIQISTRCAGWRESALDAWLRNPML